MAGNKASRSLAIILVLFLGIALGYLFRGSSGGGGDTTRTPCPTSAVLIVTLTPTPAPTCVPPAVTTPGVQKVNVGTNACPTPECVSVMAYRDTIQWNAAKSTSLKVDFDEEIFLGMTHNSSGTYSVPCTGPQCNSGQVKMPPSTPPPGTTKEVGYTLTLQPTPGLPQQCKNARIIIQW